MKSNAVVLAIFAFCAGFRAGAATDGLVRHYDFAEGKRSVLNDRSGSGTTARISGAKWVEQPRGHALKFDGKDDYVDCGKLSPTPRTITLEAWVYPEAVPTAEPRLLGWEMRSCSMTYYKDADVWFYVNGRGKCGADMPPGDWHHVVGTFDGKVVRLFIDGRLVGESKAKERTINKPKENLFIGGKPGSSVMFNGMVREVRVYGRALSRDEVWKRYQDSSQFGRIETRPYVLPSGKEVAVELDFRGLGELPKDAVVEVALAGAGGRKVLAKRKLQDVRSWGCADMVMNVPDLAAGKYLVRAQVTDAQGKPIGKKSIERLDVPAGPPEPTAKTGRRLNNLVTELLNLKDLSSQSRAEFTFTNPREGWVFIRTTATRDEQATLRVILDRGDSVNLYKKSPKPSREAMRFLPAGKHTLSAQTQGKAALDTLVVRAIPQLMHCTFSGNWDFLKRDVLGNVNVLIGSGEYERYESLVERWKKRGKKWIVAAVGAPYLKGWSANKSYEYWARNPGFSHPRLDGVMADEYGSKPLDRYPPALEAIRRLRRNEAFRGKQFIPYICRLHEAFVKPMVEIGYPYAWENYLREMSTRADGLRFLKTGFADRTAAFEKKIPGFTRNLIVCFGYLSRPPQSLDCNPSVNFLVWMDMQFNVLANAPAFSSGVYGVMEYITSYADEEAVRWAGRLYRHYCIEGNRTLLSSDPYLLPHIRNPDFEEGLRGWTVSPAAAGSMSVRTDYGYGYLQGRYYRIGNSFLQTKTNAARPNVFAQEITNLQAGRAYSLKMFTADYGDYVKDKPVREGMHAVSITLDNVDVLPDKCFQRGYLNIHKRLGQNASQHQVWFNYHRQVFRAKGRTARLTVSDWANRQEPGGPAGQELMFNFIQVQPYLDDSR